MTGASTFAVDSSPKLTWYSADNVNRGGTHMALPRGDNLIEQIKRTDAFLEYAVLHCKEKETERFFLGGGGREKLASMGDKE